MKPTPFACFIVIGSMIAACTPAPRKAQYTVEQYLANRELMNSTVEECARNPGELRDDPDCINAIAAAKRGSGKTLRELYGQPAAPTSEKQTTAPISQ